MPLDAFSIRCFTFIRENVVFHTNLFFMGRAFYSKSDMDMFDESFQKQLLSNYSEFRYLPEMLWELIYTVLLVLNRDLMMGVSSVPSPGSPNIVFMFAYDDNASFCQLSFAWSLGAYVYLPEAEVSCLVCLVY
jgi:hypothetical protein